MSKVGMFKLAASTLILGASMTSFGAGGLARTTSDKPESLIKIAAKAARLANKHLVKGRASQAVAQAEAAVESAPGNADYRALLGYAYLAEGRFKSAASVLDEAFKLNPTDARAALNLALAQTALGQQDAALTTLARARSLLPVSDYGLALALAGNSGSAVRVLEGAAREANADSKTRQNLALSYALSNRWAEARKVASQDLAPQLVEQRMTEWASFVRPRAAWDQVANLLGVNPAWDPGMPTGLALAREVPTRAASILPQTTTLAVATSAPIQAAPQPVYETTGSATFEIPETPSARPKLVAAATPAKPAVAKPAAPAPTMVVARPAAPAPATVVAKRAAPAPASLISAERAPIKRAVTPALRTVALEVPAPIMAKAPAAADAESGKFVVQLGAYSNVVRATAAWKSVHAKVNELGNFAMSIPRIEVNGAALYRLSVSGFVTSEAANQVCTRVKAAGGQCYVRSTANGSPLQWAKRNPPRGGTQIAARR